MYRGPDALIVSDLVRASVLRVTSAEVVAERAFGSLKYEHLYRHADQIATLADLHREAEHYRMIFNQIRPHEALAMRRPIEIITDPSCTRSTTFRRKNLCQKLDARQASPLP